MLPSGRYITWDLWWCFAHDASVRTSELSTWLDCSCWGACIDPRFVTLLASKFCIVMLGLEPSLGSLYTCRPARVSFLVCCDCCYSFNCFNSSRCLFTLITGFAFGLFGDGALLLDGMLARLRLLFWGVDKEDSTLFLLARCKVAEFGSPSQLPEDDAAIDALLLSSARIDTTNFDRSLDRPIVSLFLVSVCSTITLSRLPR